jgi:hypothetical protein
MKASVTTSRREISSDCANENEWNWRHSSTPVKECLKVGRPARAGVRSILTAQQKVLIHVEERYPIVVEALLLCTPGKCLELCLGHLLFADGEEVRRKSITQHLNDALVCAVVIYQEHMVDSEPPVERELRYSCGSRGKAAW